MGIMDKIRQRRAEIRQGKLNRSKENIESLRAELKEVKAHNAIISEEANLKAKLERARGPSTASRIVNKVQEHLKKAKSSKGSSSIFGGSNSPPPFLQSMTGGSNPFYPEPKRRRRK